ncbi:hypothetical protein [Chromohalobacter sp. 48-RD10]|uniref:type II toxin-antitoxin system RelB family antitoxin n=1 Tax=Chromohalobacter sp. 48-RD10 TaxID=2994063 RepID=UPI0032AEE4F4
MCIGNTKHRKSLCTQEQADSSDRWFRAKVQEAIDSDKPSLPHSEAMARLDRLMEERRRQRIGETATEVLRVLHARQEYP